MSGEHEHTPDELAVRHAAAAALETYRQAAEALQESHDALQRAGVVPRQLSYGQATRGDLKRLDDRLKAGRALVEATLKWLPPGSEATVMDTLKVIPVEAAGEIELLAVRAQVEL